MLSICQNRRRRASRKKAQLYPWEFTFWNILAFLIRCQKNNKDNLTWELPNFHTVKWTSWRKWKHKNFVSQDEKVFTAIYYPSVRGGFSRVAMLTWHSRSGRQTKSSERRIFWNEDECHKGSIFVMTFCMQEHHALLYYDIYWIFNERHKILCSVLHLCAQDMRE